MGSLSVSDGGGGRHARCRGHRRTGQLSAYNTPLSPFPSWSISDSTYHLPDDVDCLSETGCLESYAAVAGEEVVQRVLDLKVRTRHRHRRRRHRQRGSKNSPVRGRGGCSSRHGQRGTRSSSSGRTDEWLRDRERAREGRKEGKCELELLGRSLGRRRTPSRVQRNHHTETLYKRQKGIVVYKTIHG